jgi:putative transposase
MQNKHKISINRSCNLCKIGRASYYYNPQKSAIDNEIEIQLKILAKKHPRWGIEKMGHYLRHKGNMWNFKRFRRIYCELGLNLRIKPRKHFGKTEPVKLLQPLKKNLYWSIDFMTDTLMSGTKFRTFNVLDDYNREGIGIKVAFSIPASRVTAYLDTLAKTRGYPENIRVDNGPEFISGHFKEWAKLNNITIHYIQPGKPAQNAYIERFNRTYREDVLSSYLFNSLEEINLITHEWLYGYNKERPHQSLGNLSPIAFANKRMVEINTYE